MQRKLTLAVILLMAFGIAATSTADAQDATPGPTPALPGDAAASPTYPVIATIEIDRQDIFNMDDPAEQHTVYRWADKLHVLTRERVIRRELLFKEGDPADPAVLYESERNLRVLPFLHDNVHIEALPRADGRVDVVVHTRDIWTTRPSASISRQGNSTTGRFSFAEQNLFGLGKQVELTWRKDLDRTSGGIMYNDSRVGGSRWALNAAYFQRSDGDLYGADLDRPFFSVNTRASGGGGGNHFTQVTILQLDGNDAPGFRQDHTDAVLRYGLALRTGYDTTQRLMFRFRYQEDLFDVEPGEPPLSTRPPVGGAGYVALPEDRRFRILEAEFSSSNVRYERVSHLDKFDRYEDINLGNSWAASLGVSPTFLGDDANHVFFSGHIERWFHFTPSSYAVGRVLTSGRLQSGVGEDVVTGFDIRHYYLGLPRQTLVSHLQHTWGHNLDGDHQLLLGGESGLRGYDSRRFDGNKSLLANVEDRTYLVFDWLHLFSVAFTSFADAGFVWRAGESEDLGDIVSDVGIGFRFDVTRGSGGTVIRLDYAYPLDGQGQIENPRGILSISAGQAF